MKTILILSMLFVTVALAPPVVNTATVAAASYAKPVPISAFKNPPPMPPQFVEKTKNIPSSTTFTPTTNRVSVPWDKQLARQHHDATNFVNAYNAATNSAQAKDLQKQYEQRAR